MAASRAGEALVRARKRRRARACNCLRGRTKGARARPPRRRSWRRGANRTHGVFSRADETSPRAGATLVAWTRSSTAPVTPPRDRPRCAGAIA
eukprot:6308928-Lingulodinium_polyedra.AAC.1